MTVVSSVIRTKCIHLVLPEGVACVGDKDCGNPKLAVVVNEPLEGVRCEWQNVFAPDNDSVDVKEYSKVGPGRSP